MITIAKGFFGSQHFGGSGEAMINALLQQVEASMPKEIILNAAVDWQQAFKEIAQSLSWRLAAAEAIWGLIGAAILIPTYQNFSSTDLYVSWTTRYNLSGGSSSVWNFKNM